MAKKKEKSPAKATKKDGPLKPKHSMDPKGRPKGGAGGGRTESTVREAQLDPHPSAKCGSTTTAASRGASVRCQQVVSIGRAVFTYSTTLFKQFDWSPFCLPPLVRHCWRSFFAPSASQSSSWFYFADQHKIPVRLAQGAARLPSRQTQCWPHAPPVLPAGQAPCHVQAAPRARQEGQSAVRSVPVIQGAEHAHRSRPPLVRQYARRGCAWSILHCSTWLDCGQPCPPACVVPSRRLSPCSELASAKRRFHPSRCSSTTRLSHSALHCAAHDACNRCTAAGQKQLEEFREEMTTKVNDNYTVLLKQKTLPMALIQASCPCLKPGSPSPAQTRQKPATRASPRQLPAAVADIAACSAATGVRLLALAVRQPASSAGSSCVDLSLAKSR